MVVTMTLLTEMEVIIIMGLFNPHVIYIRLRQDDSADGGYNHINGSQRSPYKKNYIHRIIKL
jgi:hypothetical protein